MTRKSFLALCSTLFLPWRKKEEPVKQVITEADNGRWIVHGGCCAPVETSMTPIGYCFHYFDRGECRVVNDGDTLRFPPGSYLKQLDDGNWELIHS